MLNEPKTWLLLGVPRRDSFTEAVNRSLRLEMQDTTARTMMGGYGQLPYPLRIESKHSDNVCFGWKADTNAGV